jgi:hypothetical protein
MGESVFLKEYLDSKFTYLESLIKQVLTKEKKMVQLGQNILDAIAAETTIVNSVIAYIQGLLANNVISTDEATQILEHINENRTALEAAIAANVPIPPPTP